MIFYKVRVQLVTEVDTGKMKKHVEEYLVEAVSVTDAEAKIHTEFSGYSGDFEVISTVKTKIVAVLR